MMSKLLLVVFLFVAVARAVNVDRDTLKELLQVYPHLNVSALLELPEKYLEQGPAREPLFLSQFEACPTIAIPPDTNTITNLKPGNIRVVMAMGDSITAGMSAKDTSFLSLKEYRGLAYAIGGDAGVTTLPNLLKPYLPNGYPIGFATGIGSRTMPTNGLDAAVSGAINSDMLSQAQWLVTTAKANTAINFNNDWKVVTIWIGSNNLCDVCSNANNNNAANFQTQLTSALNYLYTNMPRLLVNLASNLDISSIAKITDGGCSLLHQIACSCVMSNAAVVSTNAKQYQAMAQTIANSFNSRGSTTFAVVVQPFLMNTTITIRSQLSAADCFHPSAASHGYAAIALWNNMLVPAAQKKTSWDPNAVPMCPTFDTLIYTN